MAHCPAYQGPICSLCCTLDARCGDLCKPQASLSAQWSALLRHLLPKAVWPYLDTGLGHFLLLMAVTVPLLAAVFGLLYSQELVTLTGLQADGLITPHSALHSGFLKAFMVLLVMAGIVAWWLVLAHKSRQVAQEESNRQTHLLLREIDLHRQTDEALQQAKLAADQANQAKSRYLSAISHELRTPLNSILGYAQLMGEDTNVPDHRKHAVHIIKRGGEHLLSLIEGTLDIARIETGKLKLDPKPLAFAEMMQEVAGLFELQAAEKGLAFAFDIEGQLPQWVRADAKRVRQILINLLGNAIKFTRQGRVGFTVRYGREMAHIQVSDTGPGLDAQELQAIFEPFARGTASAGAPGAGLGLTMAKMLTDLMGGQLSVSSQPGQGSVFSVKLFLPELHGYAASAATHIAKAPQRLGYLGVRRRLLVVDNEEADRELMRTLLVPLGFEVRTAASGHDCLDLLAAGYRPDAILMDLAMPGIDGWDTIRRLRQPRAQRDIDLPAIAIVSANAFDQNLDNDVGIGSEDFITKPVRHRDLLDWLERQLSLVWQTQPLAAPIAAPLPTTPVLPAPARLLALQQVVGLGFYRGILNQLDDIDRQQPECASYTDSLRILARQFQFDALQHALEQALHDIRPA